VYKLRGGDGAGKSHTVEAYVISAWLQCCCCCHKLAAHRPHNAAEVKIIDVGATTYTNRQPACDFLLMNNTDFHSISHYFPFIAQY